jgi:hypothetical protein
VVALLGLVHHQVPCGTEDVVVVVVAVAAEEGAVAEVLLVGKSSRKCFELDIDCMALHGAEGAEVEVVEVVLGVGLRLGGVERGVKQSPLLLTTAKRSEIFKKG